MDKRIFFVIAMIVCSVLFVSGCNGKLTFMARRVISEYRECLFVANFKNFNATFTGGEREKYYRYDGFSTELVEFGAVSVSFSNPPKVNEQIQYVLFIDTIQYNGALEFNPIDNTYVADIEKNISPKADVYLRVYGGGVDEQSVMTCISKDWRISYKQACTIMLKEYKKELKSQTQSNKLNGEIFIKLVGEHVNNFNSICWYVNYIGRDGTNFVCIIDVNSGEIVGKKSL